MINTITGNESEVIIARICAKRAFESIVGVSDDKLLYR